MFEDNEVEEEQSIFGSLFKNNKKDEKREQIRKNNLDLDPWQIDEIMEGNYNEDDFEEEELDEDNYYYDDEDI